MTTYVEDDNGGTVTETCLFHCAPGWPAPCDGPDCQCGCHRDGSDSRDTGDRSRLPTLAELQMRRHGDTPGLHDTPKAQKLPEFTRGCP